MLGMFFVTRSSSSLEGALCPGRSNKEMVQNRQITVNECMFSWTTAISKGCVYERGFLQVSMGFMHIHTGTFAHHSTVLWLILLSKCERKQSEWEERAKPRGASPLSSAFCNDLLLVCGWPDCILCSTPLFQVGLQSTAHQMIILSETFPMMAREGVRQVDED